MDAIDICPPKRCFCEMAYDYPDCNRGCPKHDGRSGDNLSQADKDALREEAYALYMEEIRVAARKLRSEARKLQLAQAKRKGFGIYDPNAI
jgi:hypothetical protein